MKIHEFDGGQKTVSVGNCTDFNVMVSDKYTVKTEIVFFDKNESKMLDLKVNHEFEFYYCVHGSCNLYAGNQLYKIKSNDLLQIKKSG